MRRVVVARLRTGEQAAAPPGTGARSSREEVDVASGVHRGDTVGPKAPKNDAAGRALPRRGAMSILFEDCLANLTDRFARAERVLVVSDSETGERLWRNLSVVLGDKGKEVLPLSRSGDALKLLSPFYEGTMVVYEARNPVNFSVEWVARVRDRELREPVVDGRPRYLVMGSSGLLWCFGVDAAPPRSRD